jgi:hypothetical protein
MQRRLPKPARAVARRFGGEACPQAALRNKSKTSRHARRALVISILATTFLSTHSQAQKTPPQKPAAQLAGLQIVSNAGEPELRVDGVPFFVHAAQFDYFRIPADLWFRSLDRYKELGINTIDLRIPWNWHELRDAQFDFDGHTNPRRNLRGLLQLIAEKQLKVIARPGPLIGDHWRNAGYPSWLLKYSGYNMEETAVQEGLSSPNADLEARDADAAARSWLANETHMTYARRWMTAIARELAPFASTKTVGITEPSERAGETQVNDVSGPLLFVALEDALVIQAGSGAADLSRYLSELRRGLERGGLAVDIFANLPDVMGQGSPSLFTTIPPGEPKTVGLTSEWLLGSSKGPPESSRVHSSSSDPHDRALLTTRDASALSFLANSLGTQPHFPPLLSGLATTTFAPADDIRASQPPPENMLLASRLLLGSGIRGFTYSPLQDTLTPAGWGTPSAARYFRWDAALDLAGNQGPHAIGITRNGQLISNWGAMLASSHLRADFGIVDLRTCLGSVPADEFVSSHIARTIEQIARVSELAGYTPELLNPAEQPVERLLRNAVMVLPVPEKDPPISEIAQVALVEFVKRGGVLVYLSSRPSGGHLEQLWQSAPAIASEGEGTIDWAFERGRVIASSNDFYSWVLLAEDFQRNLAHSESSKAIETLTSLLVKAGAPRSLGRAGTSTTNPELFISQLVSNEDSTSPARPHTCVEKQLCAAALVSVTNLSADESAEDSFEITDPGAHTPEATAATIPFHITIPAHESLLLPVHAPLCSAAVEERCTDEVISAGAELLGAERDGKTLELTFYAPARATVRLHLESQPAKVDLGGDFRLENQWTQETGELEFSLLRGAAPDYRRVVQIHLRYTPHVVEKLDPTKSRPGPSEYDVFDSVRLPLASDASIPTGPPLIATGPGGGHLIVTSRNRGDNIHSVDFSLDGAFHGTAGGRVFPGEQMFLRLRFQPTRSSATSDATPSAAADGLLQGQLTLRSGREHGGAPILFVPAIDSGNAHYQYDFDRDGEPEWVLESDRLRMIVSPADAGRALAFVDKSTNDDLITLGGALQDFLPPEAASPGMLPVAADFAFNRAYRAKWVEEKQGTGLQLDYSEHENSPAGLHVEKTLRLTAPETVEAAYRVSQVAAPFAPASPAEPRQPFISRLSVPATASEEVSTRFCWLSGNSLPSPSTSTQPAKSAPDTHCEDFVASGKPIVIPPEIVRLEVRTSGRSALAVEWMGVHATIVPRNFSAQIEFALPAPLPGAAPAEFTLRYTVGDAKP